MPSVSVIVRADHTDQEVISFVLDALGAQRSPAVEEIILVDSSPDEEPLQIVCSERVHRVRLPRSEFSYGGALNLGCSKARGRVFVTLNGHTVPVGRCWLDGMVSPLLETGAAGVCGCQSGLWPRGRALKPTVLTRDNFGPPAWTGLSTANLALTREIWEQFPFDETVPYGEDKEWGRRVVLAGNFLMIKVPAVIFHSHPERGLREQLRHKRWHGYCEARFALTPVAPPGLGFSLLQGAYAAVATWARSWCLRRGFRLGVRSREITVGGARNQRRSLRSDPVSKVDGAGWRNPDL